MPVHYSLESIRELIGDDAEMQKELLALFTQSVVETIEAIHQTQQAEEIKKAVHKIKPSVQLMGNQEGFAMAVDLESKIVESQWVQTEKLNSFCELIATMRLEILKDFPELA